ncbi:hypothetical protein IWX49DRAFT_586686 [Phyllosticta citricarpa]|uniref:Uncharacterized protein n=1 Tax=Phyllosticta citricarpa TaxID=55181 RepID=A0ABR1MQK6_9PEZI
MPQIADISNFCHQAPVHNSGFFQDPSASFVWYQIDNFTPYIQKTKDVRQMAAGTLADNQQYGFRQDSLRNRRELNDAQNGSPDDRAIYQALARQKLGDPQNFKYILNELLFSRLRKVSENTPRQALDQVRRMPQTPFDRRTRSSNYNGISLISDYPRGWSADLNNLWDDSDM